VKSGVVTISSTDFAFADCRTVPFPGTSDPTRLCIKGGFNNQLGYELVRLAKDPYISGVGEAAMRDVTSFFRYEAADNFGTPNPLAGRIQYVLNIGVSQSGRLGKHFLNNGFNEDDSGTVGRIVLDGMNPDIAGMMGSFNIRFGKEGDIAEMYDPGSAGTLWWEDYTDTVRGHTTWGLLHRCRVTNCQIWKLRRTGDVRYSHGSVGIAGTKGTETFRCRITCGATIPGTARRRPAAGTSAPVGQSAFPPPTRIRKSNRALHIAMIDRVKLGILPPPSVSAW
jgi:hypothetical protein